MRRLHGVWIICIALCSGCAPDGPPKSPTDVAPQESPAPLAPVDSMNEAALVAEWLDIAQAPEQ